MCPRQDLNLRTRLRRAVLYPLSYGDKKKKQSFYAHRRFRFYRWFVPHHLLCVHHRAGSITEYLESFKLRLGNYSHKVKVPFIRANRTSVRKGSFWASGENRTPISSLEGWSNSLYTTLAFLGGIRLVLSTETLSLTFVRAYQDTRF